MNDSQTQPTPADPPKYRVGMVARLTGLSTHTLRMWEKRHAAVVPARTPAGGRLYNDSDVARLRKLKQLVDAGHSISGVAGLETTALLALAGGTQSHETAEASRVQAEFVDAIARFDVQAAEGVLARAAAALPPREFLLRVVGPTMIEVGQRWQDGRFRIVHEHVATGVLRGLLFSLSRLYPARDHGRLVLVATPAGERHEIGALMTAIFARMHGRRVVYLGTDLPAEEIGFAARAGRAELVLLSVTSLGSRAAQASLNEVANAIGAGPRIIVGGRGTSDVDHDRVEVFETLTALDEVLA